MKDLAGMKIIVTGGAGSNGDVELGKRTLGKIAPQERIGRPREVGEAVAFLLSPAVPARGKSLR
jgi:NAD(P)-dependent dehydrogenase (short-subunit alcohol dehydrogenase family)